MITFCFVILVLGVLAHIIGRKRAALNLTTTSLILFYIFGTGFATAIFLKQLQPYHQILQPAWKTKNAIVLLGAGTVRSSTQPDVISIPTWANARITEAARLYYSCKRSGGTTCTILASGGDPGRNGISEAQVMSQELEALGIPSSDILREDKSRNTFQNAMFSAPMLRQGQYDRTFLVTSGFHIVRAHMLFEFFGAETIPSPADRLEAVQTWLPVSFNFVFNDLVAHEAFGVLQFHTYNFMGWNGKRD